jgi:DNA-binding SARP family transcriptional activator
MATTQWADRAVREQANFNPVPERPKLALSANTSTNTSTGRQLSLLGGFALDLDGRTAAIPQGPQRLVALLGLHETALDRNYVAGVLWGDSTEARAHGSLRSTLWKLKLEEPGAVEVRGDRLGLDPTIEVDVRRASFLARRLLNGHFEEDAMALLDPGLTWELLPGWYDDWVLLERERLRHLSLHALESLCEHLTAAHRYGPAILAGLAAVDKEPLRESAHRAIMKAHLAEGNAGEAIRRYHQYAEMAARDLGLRPSPAMRSLFEGIATVDREP